MKTVLWKSLNDEQKQKILVRHAIEDTTRLVDVVTEVIDTVKKEGDVALLAYAEQFDKVKLTQVKVSHEEIELAEQNIAPEMKQALQHAYKNIATFHKAQKQEIVSVETQPGVTCELVTRPIKKVGLYIPGGTAPLTSTALMLGVPAQIAGCEQVILCSPPPIANEILYVAKLCGIKEVYSVGGAQAIAAMAYGTETVPKIDKIFGPGNSYVTEAKRLVSNDMKGATIDMPAGPSEVLVIAEGNANANFIAADLLSQAEHGPDSQVLLLTSSSRIAHEVAEAVRQQLPSLSRRDMAQQSLIGSAIVVTESLEESIAISNQYGPEHLIIQIESPRSILPKITNAGSVFLGAWSPESVGDYASGTNHVLPTYGFTSTYSSLGLADFTKRMTVQELSAEGLQGLAQTVMTMAQSEGLDAHRHAVEVRMKKLSSLWGDE